MAGYIGKSQGVVLTSTGTNTVESQDIIDGAVTTDKIAAGAVTDAKLNSTKLDGIEAGADVTDATNVAAAGAVMTSDIGTTVLAPDGDGSQLTGITSVGGATGVSFNDNVKAQFGASNDLQIYHDGSHSYIQDAGDGQLRLLAGTNVQIWNADATKMAANFNGDTQADLRYAGDIKLTTTSTGVSITGDLAVSGSIAGAGKVLQVVNVGTYNNQSFATTAYSNISLLNATITPSSTSSKILLMYNIHGSVDGNAYLGYKIYRNSTDLTDTTYAASPGHETMFGGSPGVNGNYQVHQISFQYLDSPSTTSATTYKVYVSPQRSNGYTWRLNRSNTRGDDNQFGSTYSSVILMEIAG